MIEILRVYGPESDDEPELAWHSVLALGISCIELPLLLSVQRRTSFTFFLPAYLVSSASFHYDSRNKGISTFHIRF